MNAEIQPRPVACLLDVSAYVRPDFLARCGGKLYLSGFYDDSVNTYCCSLSPSVDVTYLCLVPEAYPEDESAAAKLNEDLIEAFACEDLGGYYARSYIERLRKAHPERFKALDFEFDPEDTREERHEIVLDDLQGNPVFC